MQLLLVLLESGCSLPIVLLPLGKMVFLILFVGVNSLNIFLHGLSFSILLYHSIVRAVGSELYADLPLIPIFHRNLDAIPTFPI